MVIRTDLIHLLSLQSKNYMILLLILFLPPFISLPIILVQNEVALCVVAHRCSGRHHVNKPLELSCETTFGFKIRSKRKLKSVYFILS